MLLSVECRCFRFIHDADIFGLTNVFIVAVVVFPLVITGRPTRSASMPVLFLPSGPKMVFLPHRGDFGPLSRAKFYIHWGRNVGIQPPKLSKFRIFAINCPLRGDSFALFFTKFVVFVCVYR